MGSAVFTPNNHGWHWYQNNAAEPTVQLANENTAPVLGNMTATVIRLRVGIFDDGGKAATGQAVKVQISTNDTDFSDLSSSTAFNYADGAATEGNSTTTYTVTGASTHGEYHESGTSQEDWAASALKELDFALVPTVNAAQNTLYYFRFYCGTTLVGIGSGHSHPQIRTPRIVAPSAVNANAAVATPTYVITQSRTITPTALNANAAAATAVPRAHSLPAAVGGAAATATPTLVATKPPAAVNVVGTIAAPAPTIILLPAADGATAGVGAPVPATLKLPSALNAAGATVAPTLVITSASPGTIYQRFMANLLNKVCDLAGDTIRLALLTDSYTIDATHNVWGDVSANEVANGNGYTTGGVALSGKAVTQGSPTKWDATDALFSGLTKAFRYGVLYDDTLANNDLIVVFDFGAQNVSNVDLTIAWNAGGIVTLTPP